MKSGVQDWPEQVRHPPPPSLHTKKLTMIMPLHTGLSDRARLSKRRKEGRKGGRREGREGGREGRREEGR